VVDFSTVEDYTSRGLCVIPVEGMGKRPLHNNWTTSNNEWSENDFQNRNIGIITGKRSNIVVIDIDNRGDESADDKAQKILGLYPTNLVSRTGSGGYHLFYRYPHGTSRVPNAVGKDGIDVRGDGGMVVVPPSTTTKGPYSWLNEGKPGDFPLAFLSKKSSDSWDERQKENARNDPDWVMRALQGVSEGGRNDLCAKLAGYFLAKGLTTRIVLSVLQDWNRKNNPPLSNRELRETVESINRAEERSIQETASKPSKSGPSKLKFGLMGFQEYMTKYGTNDVRWTVKDWLPESTICFVVSPPGSYKTWLLMDLAVSVASGMPFLGNVPVEKTGPVIIIQQEDHHVQTVERLALIATQRLNLGNPSESSGMFEVNVPPDLPIYIHTDRQLRFDDSNSTEALGEVVREIKPALVLIDPLYSTVSTDDYMARAAEQMMFMKDLRDELGTTFILAHHRKKGGDLHREGLWGSQFLNAFLETGWQITPTDNTNIKMKRHFKASKNPEEVEISWNIDTKNPVYNIEVKDSNQGTIEDTVLSIFDSGPKSVKEVADALNVDKSTASRRLKKMEADGLVEKFKVGRFQKYRVKHKFNF
tara:strand:+ start:10620 stop:12386 length:1767 start_codon:yes stop_codon:yes gene_type:complete